MFGIENEFEKYNSEAQQKWVETSEYIEYTEKTNKYTKQKWNSLVAEMWNIFKEFGDFVLKGEKPDSVEVQKLVKKLQNHITQNYYQCTNDILYGLGQMYLFDERFKNNIDKDVDGTAKFVKEAIEIYCAQ